MDDMDDEPLSPEQEQAALIEEARATFGDEAAEQLRAKMKTGAA